MNCWKCGAQTTDNTCTMCGCLQDTRQPAETPNGKSLRYIYDKLGPAATLANPANFIRCLGDIFLDDDDFRVKMAQVLQTNVGTHLYTMLSENKNIDEGAHQELMHIVRNKCSLPDEDIRPMLYLLLDMVGCAKGTKAPTGSSKEGSPSVETELPSEPVKPVEIARSSDVPKAPAPNAKPSSKKAILSIVGMLASVLLLILLLVYTQQANNSPAGQTSQKTSASTTSNGYIPAQQAIPYDFTLDGVTYTLPCPVSQLLKNGWQFYSYGDDYDTIYYSSNDVMQPGVFEGYAFKGEPGDYTSDGVRRFSPDFETTPQIFVTISNIYPELCELNECYVVGFSSLKNVSLSWNQISLGSNYQSAVEKIAQLKERCNPSSSYGKDGFLMSAAFEDYEFNISSTDGQTVTGFRMLHNRIPQNIVNKVYQLPSTGQWNGYAPPKKLGDDLLSGHFLIGKEVFQMGGPLYDLLERTNGKLTSEIIDGKEIYSGTGMVGNKVYPNTDASLSFQSGNQWFSVNIMNQTDFILSAESCMITYINSEAITLPGHYTLGSSAESFSKAGTKQGFNCSIDNVESTFQDSILNAAPGDSHYSANIARYYYSMGVKDGKLSNYIAIQYFP